MQPYKNSIFISISISLTIDVISEKKKKKKKGKKERKNMLNKLFDSGLLLTSLFGFLLLRHHICHRTSCLNIK
ncbi:hypothetical protein T06_16735 [Trichinella sp. T6]|nr:hypothetical protein T06_16735 [Trichinella sp. T6]